MEGHPARLMDEASVENNDSDNFLIPMQDAQHGAIDPSDNLSIEPTTTDTPAVEKAFLTEISANKKWIAYVVEKSRANQDKQFSLRIKNITYSSTGPVFSEGFEQDITSCMQGVDDFTYCFLSLSSNGDRVAISFCRFDSKGRLTFERPTCFVFRVNQPKIKLEKKIKCQGRAVFTPYHFAILSKDMLNFYSCEKDYKFASCLDIRHLLPPQGLSEHYIYTTIQHFFWSPSVNGPLGSLKTSYDTKSSVAMILHLTRFVEHNLLTPGFQMHALSKRVNDYDGHCVWSLTDGVRSIPFEAGDAEEIHAISYDKTLAAVFGETSSHLSVYHLRSGLLVSRLKSARNRGERRLLSPYSVFEDPLYCAHFSRDNTHVFLIRILDDVHPESIYNALFVVEVWNRNTEELLLLHEKSIKYKWRSRHALMPYIVESTDSPPAFTAMYQTLSETGMPEFRLLSLVLYEGATEDAVARNWRIERCSTGPDDMLFKRGCVVSLESGVEGIRYRLLFGKFTVELWRLHQQDDQKQEDLIYIRAFHSPNYNQGKAFKETWILGEFENIRGCQDADLLPSYGILLMEDTVAIKIKYDNAVFFQAGTIFDIAEHHVDQIHLPFDDLEIAESSCISTLKEKPFEFACSGFHYIESVCRGLYYLHRKGGGTEQNIELLQQTKILIGRSIKKMKHEKSRYFTTVSGSNTLAMLASFQDGRDIIFQILQTDDLPINLFTYVRNFAKTDKKSEYVARKENALTILIEKFDYELFGLLFNRVLLHASSLGAGSFCAITDTLIFLQERSETVILQSSCQKLKFLRTETNPSDSRIAMDLYLLHNSMNAEFSDFPSYGLLEQLPTYNSASILQLLFWLQQFAIKLKAEIVRLEAAIENLTKSRRFSDHYYSDMSKSAAMAHTNLLSVCAVPFIDFSSYTIFCEDVEFNSDHGNRDDKTWTARLSAAFHKLLHPSSAEKKIAHKAESNLIHLASDQHENDLFHQKGSVIEVLLYYKWKTFIRKRFYLVCLIHLVYYLSFCSGVLFARECFAYTLGTWISGDPLHVAFIALMFISNFFLSVQELLQFLKIGFWGYVKSIYNIIDLASLVMPLVSFWMMITGNSQLDQFSAITTIILWMHGILRLRPFAFIGVTLETMIQLMKSVYKTLIIMLLVIFAFTHAFIVLLLHKDDSYFQKQYSGSINITDTENTVSYSDASASNSFTNVFKAFSTLWLFIYGVWDPITDGEAGDDFMIIAFAMLFSFVTVLLFFNLVIALMSSKAEEVKALGKSIWLSHFAEVIAEIEQFWCFRSERINRNNSPSVVYYIAKYTDVRQQAELLEQDCDSLIKELHNKLKKRQKSGSRGSS